MKCFSSLGRVPDCGVAGAGRRRFSGEGRVGQMAMAATRRWDHRSGRDGFQRHVAGALDGPFVVLLEQDCADEPDDGRSLGKMPTTSVRRLISPLSRSRRWWSAASSVLGGKAHIGEDVGLGLVHEARRVWAAWAELVGDLAPLRLGGPASSCAKAVAMKAETTRRPLLPAWASALRMVWTRQRCQVAFISLATAALMPSWASEMTSLTPRRPRRLS